MIKPIERSKVSVDVIIGEQRVEHVTISGKRDIITSKPALSFILNPTEVFTFPPLMIAFAIMGVPCEFLQNMIEM